MHPEAINEKTKKVLEKLAVAGVSAGFYLAGGTALAIQIGHRESIDLDWFSDKDFIGENLKKELSGLGDFSLTSEDEGTINCVFDGVKLSFLKYEYNQLYPFVMFDGVKLADERDIAAMKISAVSSRGSKKDFVDLYFLLQKYQMAELMGFFEKKYAKIKYNKLHILKSLEFFDNAESDPMPMMIEKADWVDIKRVIQREIDKFIQVYGQALA